MKKVIVICGPTAVGKTYFSVRLAKALDAEIISGDSVQVYKNLNIGSAKATKEEMDGVIHHLIDIKNPGEDYSVADFQRDGRKLLDTIETPIVCGGTGLYIKALLANYEFDAPSRDYDFEHKYDNYSNQELYEILQKCDPKATEKIHMNNRKRVLRAIFAAIENEPLSSKNKKDEYLYDPFIIYLDAPREVLYERIEKRVDEMIDKGLEEEVRALYEKGIYIHAIGYQEFYPYFNQEESLETVIDKIKKNSRHLAKRQVTWFKNQMNAKFYSVDFTNPDNTYNELYQDILEFLKG